MKNLKILKSYYIFQHVIYLQFLIFYFRKSNEIEFNHSLIYFVSNLLFLKNQIKIGYELKSYDHIL